MALGLVSKLKESWSASASQRKATLSGPKLRHSSCKEKDVRTWTAKVVASRVHRSNEVRKEGMSFANIHFASADKKVPIAQPV